MLKRFINHRDTLVEESINGLLRSAQGAHLARLDGETGVHVVLPKNWKRDRVAVISGGGSGHEPAHAGFVGEGLLTAAVCGAIFASPGIDAILSAIISVAGPAGCLLIVKNYTGDRLNFGLAAEQARAMGIDVEMVVVHDDIALQAGPRARGIAGTLLVHKVAGYYAARKEPLKTVARLASQAAGAVRSLGLALSDCNIFEAQHQDRIAPGTAELGLGIHGEPGAETIALSKLDTLTAELAARLENAAPAGPLVMMINTLGAVPPIEAGAIAESFSRTSLARRTDWLIGPAPLMTSLDMNGFSFSIMPAEAPFLEALQADVQSVFWPGISRLKHVATVPAPKLPKTFNAPPSGNKSLETLLLAGLNALVMAEDVLNALDARIGDGDAGTTFAGSARVIRDVFAKLPFAQPDAPCATLGRLMARCSGGSSGALLSIFLTACSVESDWRLGLQRGLESMMRYGGAKRGDRTMLDALIPAVTGLSAGDTLGDVARHARTGAVATRDMQAKAGRAAYVPSSVLANVTDPGAEAVALFFEAVARAA